MYLHENWKCKVEGIATNSFSDWKWPNVLWFKLPWVGCELEMVDSQQHTLADSYVSRLPGLVSILLVPISYNHQLG